MQAMLQQAQKLKKEVMKEKKAIDEKIYTGNSSFVTVEVLGNKKISRIKIEKDKLEQEDIEMLEDLVLISINDAMAKIDEDTEKKLGKYTNGMPGLF